MIPAVPSFELSNGNLIPAVGIGCWMGRVGEGQHVVDMVKKALEMGYRHIDTAANYGNEESVGRAIRESGVPRDKLFITTKLAGEDHGNVSPALDLSLQKLGVDYVDLYLMHWPQALKENAEQGEAYSPKESPTFLETWTEMEKLLSDGKAKSIGVSNFSVKTLSTLLSNAVVIPAVNQVEAHPCLPQHDLLKFCKDRGILVTAYSPIGKHKFATHDSLQEIARRKQVTVAQVLLSWGVQRGTAVVPKTEQAERLGQNLTLIQLTCDETRTLDNLHGEPGMHRSVCGFHSSSLGGSCFGWTYEQLGWNMVAGGIVPI